MKKKNILSLFLILSIKLFPQADTSITFNEVMFYTSSSTNSEFIELFNTSTTDTIDLNNFKFKYYTSSNDIIISAGFGTLLTPQSYAVIFEGDYVLSTGVYNGLVPSSALILKISDNAFGSSGMANTLSRDLILMNASGDTLDTYIYSANNSTGISDEKITTNKDNSSGNWTNTTQTNGTPGFRNTTTPLSFNLEITSFTSSPSLNLVGKDINISATANNTGTQTAGSYTIEIFNDTNFDSIAATSERIFTQSFTNLTPGDSTTVNTNISNPSAGAINLIAKVNYTQDEDTTNNSKIISLNVFPNQYLFNDIVINEIMYAPSSGKTEWVELFNRTDSSVNLNGWNFSDNNTTVNITNNDISIPTNSFVVLSGDSTVLSNYSVPVQLITFTNMPSLNNTGDAVVIKDSLGIIVDSLTYTTSWGGNNGNSLERIDINDSSTNQNNWGTSININGATPGIKNSLTPFDNDLKLISISHSPQLIISGDNVNLTSTVKNIGKNTVSLFSFVYYNDLNSDNIGTSNEIISTQNFSNLAKNDSVAVNFTMITPISGNYKIIGQINFAGDEDTSSNKKYDNFTVVEQNNYFNRLIVNEIMYAPLTGRTEWIEIYNRSDSSVKNFV